MVAQRERRAVSARVYVALFEDNVDGVLLTNPDGEIYAANRAACALLRCTEAQVVALGRAGVADVTDLRWGEAIDARRRHGAFRGQLRFRRADGSGFVAEVASATFDDAGELRSYVSFHDVSASVRLVDSAARDRRATASMVATLESVSDAYLAVDVDWRLTYLNRRAEQLLRVSRGEVLGNDLWAVFPTASQTNVGLNYREVMSSGATSTIEGYVEELDLHCEVRVCRLVGGGLGIYFLDLSGRRAVERERERLLAGARSDPGRSTQESREP